MASQDNQSVQGRPTIMDVARHCGVSKATVSKVLNLPREISPVAESTRVRVLASVNELGYRPSWQARSLAKRQTGMIAIVNADPYGALPRGQYWEVVDQLDGLLAQANLVPTYVHTFAGNPRAIELLADERFDGVLSLDIQPPQVLDVLRRQGTPTVMVNADVDGSWARIEFDDVGGAELLVRHLVELGHRRIAYYPGRRVNLHSSAILRAATYAKCMRDAGLEPDKVAVGPVSEFIDRALSGPYKPTAIIDFEHWTAIHVLQQLWRRGVRVPEDISVATFNDTYPVAVTVPPLTTISLPVAEIAQTAVQLLIERIENPWAERVLKRMSELLVVRESTSAPRRVP